MRTRLATCSLTQKTSGSITSNLEIQFAIYEFACYFTFGFLKESLRRCNLNYFAVVNMYYFVSYSSGLVEVVGRHYYDALTAFFANNSFLDKYSTVWIQVCCWLIQK